MNSFGWTPIAGEEGRQEASPLMSLPPLAVGAVSGSGKATQLTGRSALAMSNRSYVSQGAASYSSVTTGGHSYGSVAMDGDAAEVVPTHVFSQGGFASVPREGLPLVDGFSWRAGPELGRGISGHVHVALRFLPTGQDAAGSAQPALMAVKMVEVTSMEMQRSLEREVRVLRSISHPNIVSTRD